MYKAFPSPDDSSRGVVAKESALGGFYALYDCLLPVAVKEAERLERNHQVGEAVKAVFPPDHNGNVRYFDGDQALLFEAD